MNVAQRLTPYLMQATDESISIDLIFFDGILIFLILKVKKHLFNGLTMILFMEQNI